MDVDTQDELQTADFTSIKDEPMYDRDDENQSQHPSSDSDTSDANMDTDEHFDDYDDDTEDEDNDGEDDTECSDYEGDAELRSTTHRTGTKRKLLTTAQRPRKKHSKTTTEQLDGLKQRLILEEIANPDYGSGTRDEAGDAHFAGDRHFRDRLNFIAEKAPPEKRTKALQEARQMGQWFGLLPKIKGRLAIHFDHGAHEGQKNRWILTGFRSRLYLHQVLWLIFAVYRELVGYGLCADGMGLGKTIEALALITISQRHALPRATLVVVPTNVKGQWKSEIERHCDLGNLHGKPAFISYDQTKAISMKPRDFERASIVLVAYDELKSKKAQILLQTNWYRVILGKNPLI